MNQKIKIISIATIVGACIGAVLGFGPLQRYKSDGVLSMELGSSEYKRISELASDQVSIRQYLHLSPPSKVESEKLNEIANIVSKSEWFKPLPKLSKIDSKDLPDVVLQMERDREKEKDKEKYLDKDKDKDNKNYRKDDAVYLGLRISYTAHESTDAMYTAIWLGNYFKEVAVREAIRELISNWSADNRQFLDKALEQQYKYKFEIQQSEARVTLLKKLLSHYPDVSSKESRQLGATRFEADQYTSPRAQLISAESQIININERTQKLTRQIEQHRFASPLIEQASQIVKQANSGSESVNKLEAVIASYTKKTQTDAEREKLLNFSADLSTITARFLSQSQFIALPSAPIKPERPTPIMYTALIGILFGLFSMLYCWRKELLNLLREVNGSINTETIPRS
jgi:hypothetical protein